MKCDFDIQYEVERELRRDSRVEAAAISVNVDDGVVILDGTVTSSEQRRVAQAAARRVTGIIDLANNIEVQLPA